MRKAVALVLLLTAAPLMAQGNVSWPSPEQVTLVHDRRAAFPMERMVAAVDWYQPQEAVKGATPRVPLPVAGVGHRTIRPRAVAEAVAYADQQKSYALLVWRNDALELEKYWPGFDRTSRFETASMHKGVLALAIGIAVAEGSIHSVDDPISRYIPQLAGTRRGAQPLRAYLEMASGIETPSSAVGDTGAYWQYSLGNDLDQTVAHWPDSCAPLTQFCYANANSHYLGWALTNAVHVRYADWLSRKLWRPMGAGEARLWLDHPGGSPRYSAYLMASAQDWLRVGLLLLNKGRANGRQLVPAKWVEAMSAPSPANPNFGWHIWRGSPHTPLRIYGPHLKATVPAAEPFTRNDVIYLDGSAGQRVYVIPSEKMVIVRIGRPSYDWDDSHLPNLLLAGL